jgi:hypothetical protein
MIKKITSSLLALTLSASLYADGYFGISYGIASTDKTVYGNDSGEPNGPFIAYDDLSLLGISFTGFNTSSKDLSFIAGAGVDLYANEGDILNGGLLDANLKLGGKYKNFKAYGILGYGIQSLSDYTVAQGLLYGAGIRYDILKHLSTALEYKVNSLETTDNDDATANQSYTISGIYFSLDVKF